MSDKARHLLRLALTLGAVGLLVYWQQERLNELPAAFARATWTAVLLSGVLNASGSIVLPAVLTQIATKNAGRIEISLSRLVVMNFTLRFYSLVLPKGAVMALRWKRYNSAGRGADALALVVFERLVLFFVYVLAATIFLFFEYPQLGPNGPWVLAGVTALLLVWASCLAPFFTPSLQSVATKLACRIEPKVPRAIGSRILKLTEAISAFHKIEKRKVGAIWLVSVASYLLFVLSAYTLVAGMGVEISIVAMAWMRPLVFVLTLIPLTVGGLGVREAGYAMFMGWYGIAASTALAFGLLLFGIQVAIGAVGLVLELGTRRVRSSQ